MRTVAAYISKLKNEALGRTYKVQDTNHRVFTSTLYRGAAGCGPVDYTEIDYIEPCKCDYIGSAIVNNPKKLVISVIDGGSPASPGAPLIDGGSPDMSGMIVLDGGKP
jgi:hypothetical protein